MVVSPGKSVVGSAQHRLFVESAGHVSASRNASVQAIARAGAGTKEWLVLIILLSKVDRLHERSHFSR